MNRNSRKIMPLIATAALTLSTFAMAGPPQGDGHRGMGPPSAERMLAHLEEALDLTAEQSEALLPVLLAAEEERRAIIEEAMERTRPEICANMEATHESILAVLTPEQAAEFETLMAQRKDRMHGRGRHGGFSDLNCDENRG